MTTIEGHVDEYGNVILYFPGQLRLHIAPRVSHLTNSNTTNTPYQQLSPTAANSPTMPLDCSQAQDRAPRRGSGGSYTGPLMMPADWHLHYPQSQAPKTQVPVPLPTNSGNSSGPLTGSGTMPADWHFHYPPMQAQGQIPLTASSGNYTCPSTETMPTDWRLPYPPNQGPMANKGPLNVPLDSLTRSVSSLASPSANSRVVNLKNAVNRGFDYRGDRDESRYNIVDGEFTLQTAQTKSY
jgi:hypothetical protein